MLVKFGFRLVPMRSFFSLKPLKNKKKNKILKRYVYKARTARAIPQRNLVLKPKRKKKPRKKREVFYLIIR